MFMSRSGQKTKEDYEGCEDFTRGEATNILGACPRMKFNGVLSFSHLVLG